MSANQIASFLSRDSSSQSNPLGFKNPNLSLLSLFRPRQHSLVFFLLTFTLFHRDALSWVTWFRTLFDLLWWTVREVKMEEGKAHSPSGFEAQTSWSRGSNVAPQPRHHSSVILKEKVALPWASLILLNAYQTWGVSSKCCLEYILRRVKSWASEYTL